MPRSDYERFFKTYETLDYKKNKAYPYRKVFDKIVILFLIDGH